MKIVNIQGTTLIKWNTLINSGASITSECILQNLEPPRQTIQKEYSVLSWTYKYKEIVARINYCYVIGRFYNGLVTS